MYANRTSRTPVISRPLLLRFFRSRPTSLRLKGSAPRTVKTSRTRSVTSECTRFPTPYGGAPFGRRYCAVRARKPYGAGLAALSLFPRRRTDVRLACVPSSVRPPNARRVERDFDRQDVRRETNVRKPYINRSRMSECQKSRCC